MGFLSGSVLLIIAASAGSLAANVGLNTLQSWYDPMYLDWFWGSRGLSPEGSAQLAREEARVRALMQDDAAAQPAPPSPGAGCAAPGTAACLARQGWTRSAQAPAP